MTTTLRWQDLVLNWDKQTYEELSKEVRTVIDMITKFIKKYPDCKNYLNDEQILFKHQIDYHRSKTNSPRVIKKRSYIEYFMYISRDKTDEELEIIRRVYDAYARIKRIIIEQVIPEHQNHAKCGCRKCYHEVPAYKFLKSTPFLCPKCRGWIKFVKRHTTDVPFGDPDFNYWYLKWFAKK